jgi:pimeloyl-ACP methyl ester carboxylesterase
VLLSGLQVIAKPLSGHKDVTNPVLALLPGLDGTCELFAAFEASAPRQFSIQTIPLPREQALSYRELADWAHARLPAGPVVLIAESFSGPLAILLAERCPNVVSIVLSTTFVKSPLPRPFFPIPEFAWRHPPPSLLVRAFLTGGDRDLAKRVRAVLTNVPPRTLAGRVAAVLDVDVTAELTRLSQPILCLRALEDRIVSARSTAYISACKPSAHVTSLHGPHLLLQRFPRDAWRSITPFIERVTDGSPRLA